MKHLFTFLLIAAYSFSYAQSLQSIESVEYDPTQNRFLVSNSNNIIARNSDGSLDFFGSGAASFGMEVMGNTLFAISGSNIKGYDLTSEEEVMSANISGASFLNGLTNDGSENLYATDFSAQTIYKINVADFANPVVETLVANTMATPNGIVYDGDNNRLIFVTWGSNASVRAVDLTDNSLSTLTTTPYSNIDGIDEDNEGSYYISYWSSGTRISKYDADFSNPPTTVAVSGLSSPADICYAKAIDTLAIPHSGNQLTFIGFNTTTNTENDILDASLQLKVSPNPMTAQSQLSFYLEQTSQVNIQIFDQQARLLHQLLDGPQVAGQHLVPLAHLELPNAVLFAKIQVNNYTKWVKIVNL